MNTNKGKVPRRAFCRGVLATALACRLPKTTWAGSDPQPPNVLFIAVDDLRRSLDVSVQPMLRRRTLTSWRQAVSGSRTILCRYQRAAHPGMRYLTGRSPANSGVTSSNAAFYQGKPP